MAHGTMRWAIAVAIAMTFGGRTSAGAQAPLELAAGASGRVPQVIDEERPPPIAPVRWGVDHTMRDWGLALMLPGAAGVLTGLGLTLAGAGSNRWLGSLAGGLSGCSGSCRPSDPALLATGIALIVTGAVSLVTGGVVFAFRPTGRSAAQVSIAPGIDGLSIAVSGSF